MSGKQILRTILFICISIVAGTACMAKQQSSIDTGSFVFSDYKPFSNRAIKVSYYYPKNRQNAPVLFVMHGNGREYQGYFKAMLKYAKKYNFVLVVPEFDAKRFPTIDYHQGGLFSRDKTARDKKDWTFAIIEPLFDFVKKHAGNNSSGYYLYGFSAGSQFVHRYLMFTPENRVISAISGSAGTYTMPDYDTEYSYGLKNTNLPKANLEKFYAKDFQIIVGDADTVLSRADLVKTPVANRQGRDRVERAYNFHKQSKAMANSLKTPFNWPTVKLVEHAGHSQSSMAETVAKLLFEDK